MKVVELKGNGKLVKAVISSYGAAIMKLIVLDKDGIERDIVLGFDKPEDYENNGAFFGVVVGPIANRTALGKFQLNGNEYNMEINEGRNNLHFHFTKGFHKTDFDVVSVTDTAVCLSHSIKDMEDGLPGNRTVSIIYELKDDAISINYEISSDMDTVFNSTNHSYFNLNGHETGKIYGHELFLNCSDYTEIDSELIPTGNLIPIKGSEFDYSEYKVFDENSAPIDHNFVRSGDSGLAAKVKSAKTGIEMTVKTDLPGIQIYTGGSIAPMAGKNGASYDAFCGIALETQFFPNSLNEGTHNDKFAFPLVKAGEIFKTTTTYQF